MITPAPNPVQPGWTAQLGHRDRVAEHNARQEEILAQRAVGEPVVKQAETPKPSPRQKPAPRRQNSRSKPE
jgi:hypothetical protein